MFKDITDILSKNKGATETVHLEYGVDKVFRKYSIALILICSAFITRQYIVNNSISCFAPVSIGDEKAFSVYLNQYGWMNMRSSRFSFAELNANNDLLKTSESPSIVYYYWIPFILMFQALMIWIPYQLWDYFCRRSNGRDYVQLVEKARNINKENEGDDIEVLHKEFKQIIDENKEVNVNNWRGKCRRYFKIRGNKLSMMYVFLIAIYWLVSIGQLFFMMKIFGFENAMKYGNGVWVAIKSGGFMLESPQFPRMVYTKIPDFYSMGGNLNLIAQCILPMNMVLEKIVLILSLWFLFLSIVQTLRLIRWFMSIFVNWRRNFIMKLLGMTFDKSNKRRNQIVDEFITRFLQKDGVFVLKMISLNCPKTIASGIATEMYKFYRKETNRVIPPQE